jgi:hypothetical protein
MTSEVRTVITKERPGAEVFHFIMIIATCGLWIPVWLLMRAGRKSVAVTAGPAPAAPPGDSGPRDTTPSVPRYKLPEAGSTEEWQAQHVPGSKAYREAQQI